MLHTHSTVCRKRPWQKKQCAQQKAFGWLIRPSKDALSPGWNIVAISNAAVAVTTTSTLASCCIFLVGNEWCVFLQERVGELVKLVLATPRPMPTLPNAPRPRTKPLVTQTRVAYTHKRMFKTTHDFIFFFAYLLVVQAAALQGSRAHNLKMDKTFFDSMYVLIKARAY
jgi:hypothetical protein